MKDPEKVRQQALQYSRTLVASDKRFDCCVFVQHQDGTQMFFNNAFALTCDSYIIVITEHNSVHVFAEDDLHDYGQYINRVQLKTIDFGVENGD